MSNQGTYLPPSLPRYLIESPSSSFSLRTAYKGKRLEWFRLKLPNLALALKVPFHVFAANDKHDHFRKPLPGMWLAYRGFNDGIDIGELDLIAPSSSTRPVLTFPRGIQITLRVTLSGMLLGGVVIIVMPILVSRRSSTMQTRVIAHGDWRLLAGLAKAAGLPFFTPEQYFV